jgi:hypothetical protein
VNERQAYALTHPISDARPRPGATDPYRAQRVVRGLLIMSILAVDR